MQITVTLLELLAGELYVNQSSTSVITTQGRRMGLKSGPAKLIRSI